MLVHVTSQWFESVSPPSARVGVAASNGRSATTAYRGTGAVGRVEAEASRRMLPSAGSDRRRIGRQPAASASPARSIGVSVPVASGSNRCTVKRVVGVGIGRAQRQV